MFNKHEGPSEDSSIPLKGKQNNHGKQREGNGRRKEKKNRISQVLWGEQERNPEDLENEWISTASGGGKQGDPIEIPRNLGGERLSKLNGGDISQISPLPRELEQFTSN